MLLTIKQFSEKYPWPSESALRALIFHKKIEGAVLRSGRRVLVDEDKFFEILKMRESQGNHKQSGQQKIDPERVV